MKISIIFIFPSTSRSSHYPVKPCRISALLHNFSKTRPSHFAWSITRVSFGGEYQSWRCTFCYFIL